MNVFDWTLWPTLIAIGLATTLPRASFIVLGNRVTLPSVVQRALRYAPAAALAAIVAPDIFVVQGSTQFLSPKLGAAIAVITIVSVWKNPWAPFVIGMGVLYALRALPANLT